MTSSCRCDTSSCNGIATGLVPIKKVQCYSESCTGSGCQTEEDALNQTLLTCVGGCEYTEMLSDVVKKSRECPSSDPDDILGDEPMTCIQYWNGQELVGACTCFEDRCNGPTKDSEIHEKLKAAQRRRSEKPSDETGEDEKKHKRPRNGASRPAWSGTIVVILCGVVVILKNRLMNVQ